MKNNLKHIEVIIEPEIPTPAQKIFCFSPEFLFLLIFFLILSQSRYTTICKNFKVILGIR